MALVCPDDGAGLYIAENGLFGCIKCDKMFYPSNQVKRATVKSRYDQIVFDPTCVTIDGAEFNFLNRETAEKFVIEFQAKHDMMDMQLGETTDFHINVESWEFFFSADEAIESIGEIFE